MNQPLLSVIVPCYNVEKYMDKCISSIVRQTYTNLEILLINDGSTDETGMFCNSWQKKDSRIKVIHKQNEGLDYARKTGIENAAAEYIAFVDADDWIDENMYAKMMSAMLDTNSEIARCEFCFVYPDGRMVQRNITHKTDNIEIIGREEGVLLILEDKKWHAYWWLNVFKKSLFDDYVHQKGRLYEDIAGTHILFHHAKQTVYLHDAFYYYYQRSGSLVNPQNIHSKANKSLHLVNALYERYLWAKQYPQYHSALHIVKRKALVRGLVFLRGIIDYPQYSPATRYKEQTERLRKIPLSLRDIKLFIFQPDLLILKILPSCYKPLYRLLRRLYNFMKRRHYSIHIKK